MDDYNSSFSLLLHSRKRRLTPPRMVSSFNKNRPDQHISGGGGSGPIKRHQDGPRR